MLASARVTLKLHRFEVGAALTATVLLGAWCLYIRAQLVAIGVPADCMDDWANIEASGRSHCVGPMASVVPILVGDSENVFSLLRALPIVVGLLGAVTLVARELEARTAQVAWSLSPSRVRWLFRQAVPVLVVLGAATAFAGLSAGWVQRDREMFGLSAFEDIGVHGPLLVGRMLGTFGLGLLVGAVVGRSLPALVVGIVLSAGLLSAVGLTRDAWVAAQERALIGDSHTSLITGWVWRATDGSLLDDATAKALVPPEVSALDHPVQPTYSIEWLEAAGYELLPVGVTQEVALGWVPMETFFYLGLGVAAFGATVLVVARRRPT
jgi:hypothetical protein